MWHRIYFIGKFKIMLIVNEIIFLHYFNIVIQSLDRLGQDDIYNTCALSKHIGNMCMRLRNAGKGEASPILFPRFAPNTHIYPAISNRK
jgi:hypothetical protein